MYFVLLLTFAALYTGLCFYINGMVDDLKAQVQNADAMLKRESTRQRVDKTEIWLTFVKQFQFHREILGQVAISTNCFSQINPLFHNHCVYTISLTTA